MKIYNYAVIGGGISGLLCGHLFDDVIVLEKNSQVGGRTASNTLDKVKIDVGAQFLSKSLAKQLEDEFNLPHLKEVKEPSTVFVINNKKIVYSSFIRFLSELPIS